MSGTTENIGAPVAKDLNTYRKEKLKILSNDFCIQLTTEEMAHAKELKSEIAIDNFCLSVINHHWC